MRRLTAAVLLTLTATPLAAQQARDSAHAKGHAARHDPDHAVSGGGALPDGWSARTDGRGGTANVKFATMGTGYHVTLGPAAILWRATDRVSGPFHTLATFTQTKAPAHPEGYGLFFGGKALDGAGQQYTYFLVRGDGTFLIKRRNGDETTNVTQGWTAHSAVNKADASGKATNKLEIDGKSNGDKIRFLVNGKPVYEADPKAFDLNGLIGFRVNHNLDVHVDGFDIHRM